MFKSIQVVWFYISLTGLSLLVLSCGDDSVVALDYTGKLYMAGRIDANYYTTDVCWIGDDIVVSDAQRPAKIYDIRMPYDPQLLGNIQVDANIVMADGDYLYTARCQNMYVFEKTDSIHYRQISMFYQQDETHGIRDFRVDGDYAYLAFNCELLVVNISQQPYGSLTGFKVFPDSARGLEKSGNYVYVTNSDSGLRVIDVTNPIIPQEINVYKIRGCATDVVLDGNYAYVSRSDSIGLSVLNLNISPDSSEISAYKTLGPVKEICKSGNNLFLAISDSGIEVVDISNPQSPRGMCEYQGLSFINSLDVKGNAVYVADGYGGLAILKFKSR